MSEPNDNGQGPEGQKNEAVQYPIYKGKEGKSLSDNGQFCLRCGAVLNTINHSGERFYCWECWRLYSVLKHWEKAI